MTAPSAANPPPLRPSGLSALALLLNRALLYCFHYDPVGKKYVLFASRLMTGAMLVIMMLTLGLLALLWKREKRGPL